MADLRYNQRQTRGLLPKNRPCAGSATMRPGETILVAAAVPFERASFLYLWKRD